MGAKKHQSWAGRFYINGKEGWRGSHQGTGIKKKKGTSGRDWKRGASPEPQKAIRRRPRQRWSSRAPSCREVLVGFAERRGILQTRSSSSLWEATQLAGGALTHYPLPYSTFLTLKNSNDPLS